MILTPHAGKSIFNQHDNAIKLTVIASLETISPTIYEWKYMLLLLEKKIILCDNSVHAMTAQLSWCVQNCYMIWSLELKSAQKELSPDELINCFWNGSMALNKATESQQHRVLDLLEAVSRPLRCYHEQAFIRKVWVLVSDNSAQQFLKNLE